MSDPNIKADPSASYQLLRRETATMLKLGDVDALGLVEGLQLDVVSLLRLELDGLQGAVLAGQPVDLDRLATAHGLLQKMLPTQALVASAPLPEASTARFGADHKARLRQLIENVVLAPAEAAEAAEAERLADSMAREEATAADDAAGKPPEERRPLRDTLAPSPEIVPFPSKNIATGQQPHLKAAGATLPTVSAPAASTPRTPDRPYMPAHNPEGWSDFSEPWRGWTRP